MLNISTSQLKELELLFNRNEHEIISKEISKIVNISHNKELTELVVKIFNLAIRLGISEKEDIFKLVVLLVTKRELFTDKRYLQIFERIFFNTDIHSKKKLNFLLIQFGSRNVLR